MDKWEKAASELVGEIMNAVDQANLSSEREEAFSRGVKKAMKLIDRALMATPVCQYKEVSFGKIKTKCSEKCFCKYFVLDRSKTK
jgi:hypothetical protein